MPGKKICTLLVSLIFCSALFGSAEGAAPVQRPGVTRDAEIVSLQGEGRVRFSAEQDWREARERQVLTAGDLLKTGSYGRMSILFADETQIKVHKNSLLLIKGVARTPSGKGTRIRLDLGEVWSRARSNPDGLVIETPTATGAIRGTDWDIAVDEKGTTTLSVLKGAVELYNDQGRVLVGKGEQAVAEAGKAPVKTVLVKPRERVQWVSSWRVDPQALLRLPAGEGSRAQLELALTHLYRNEPSQTAQILEALAQKEDSADLGAATASFKAWQGDFSGALEICRAYAQRFPSDDRFPVLAASFLLVLDQGEQAREAAQKALTINPRSAPAQNALGKYHYLEGDAAAAEGTYRAAVALDPADSEARDGLGVVLMEQGHFEEALANLSGAVQLAPGRPDHLARRGMLFNWIEKLNRAQGDYRGALARDPADYQSLDGLGLVALKEGKNEEAIGHFLKASLLEPEFAEPHLFLAVAYYQRGDVVQALEELKLAAILEPKDPVPHIMAYVIYQDTYRPFEAVREARKALELLPYLKSLTPVETTQQGLTNLGSALLGAGLTEWGTSFAEESFNPYDAASYFFTARRFEANRFLFISQMNQGFILDPLAVSPSPRYQDLVKRPQANLTLNTTLGSEEGHFSREHEATFQGYARRPWETSWFLSATNFENDGFRANGDSRGNNFTLALGGKPDYRNGFFLWGVYDDKKSGDAGTLDDPDRNDRRRDTLGFAAAGYNRRLGPKGNLLAQVAYGWAKSRFDNPDSLGAGLTPVQTAFINSFGSAGARDIFARGLFDIGVLTGSPGLMFATDSTGLLGGVLGLTPLAPIPAGVETDPTRSLQGRLHAPHYQLRHLFTLADRHQLSYGAEYVPSRFASQALFTNLEPDPGTLFSFVEEFTTGSPVLLSGTLPSSELQSRAENDSFTAYLNDRWSVSDRLLLEAGLFYESFRSNLRGDRTRLNPRAGLALRVGERHIMRGAFQKRLISAALTTLAPVATAGLYFDPVQPVSGSTLTDYQAQLESRWSGRLFTSLNAERREIALSETGLAGSSNEERSDLVSGAVNAILTERTGLFARYRYANSEFRNGSFRGKSVPLVPEHLLTGGVVWVSPLHVKATLSASYLAGQFGDPGNSYRMPNYWKSDLSATWEPLDKRVLLNLALLNIFDEDYETAQGRPAAGRSGFVTLEYRF